MQRWRIALQAYNFAVRWIPGDKNIVADILSRQLVTEQVVLSVLSTSHQYYRGLIQRQDTEFEGDAYRILSQLHGATTGHFGVDTTMQKLKQLGYAWPDMAADTASFVRNCPTCQRMADTKFQLGSAPFSTSTRKPMERLDIDSIGPLPKDEDGNEYIIVIIDTFTRFVELFRRKDATAISAATAVIEHFGRYGLPIEILTDQGPQYHNAVLEHLTHKLGVQHIITTPYSHQENGLVERVNKEVTRHLRNIVLDRRVKTEWSSMLPLVQRIINSKVHKVTKFAPATLLFGNNIDLDRHLFSPFIPDHEATNPPTDMPDYVARLIESHSKLMEAAAANQEEWDIQRQTKRPVATLTEFPVGSLVLVAYPDKKRPDKLDPYYHGPYQVHGSTTAADTTTVSMYTLKQLSTGQLKSVGRHLLRPFHLDGEYVDPLEVSLRGTDEFVVEAILGHYPKEAISRFIKRRKSDMSFLVKWVGYDKPTYNSWDGLRKNAVFIQYLKDSKLEALIPKNLQS